jgi:hypothetical protein
MRLSCLPLWVAACAGLALAQTCAQSDATLPAMPLHYPMNSDRYAVQYSLNGAGWTSGTVYVSYYGGTDASPWRSDSGYSLPYQTSTSSTSPIRPPWETSLSFVNIPAQSNAFVQLRVTKLFGTPFQPSDHVSVRPNAKWMDVDTLPDGTVQISTFTAGNFMGEQFILWWNRGAEGGAVEGLAFFLNPPYQQPTGNGVLTIHAWNDLNGANLTGIDTLDFEGPLAVQLGGDGTLAYTVPDAIQYIFLGPGAWVQGKLRFDPSTTSPPTTRWIYGPGVLDVSRFNYLDRACSSDEGLYALTSTASNAVLDHFHIDGIMILDHNHAANHSLFNSSVNNVKTLGWNGENAALRIGNNTTVANSFIRSGDDSLMMWGMGATVTDATVWQNYNGGVVNLGWSYNSPGTGCAIDGLYVVKTDWQTVTPSWMALPPTGNPLQGQNNAVFASLMIPGTNFGSGTTPVFQNIFVEDPPQVLFSLKIMPPICADTGMSCPSVDLNKNSGYLYLDIKNLFSPASLGANSIGFQTVPAGYPNATLIRSKFTLTGSMNIGFTNLFLQTPDGLWLPLTSADAQSVFQIGTSGSVSLQYSFGLP